MPHGATEKIQSHNILSQKNYTDQRTVLPQNREIPDSAIIFNSLVSCV